MSAKKTDGAKTASKTKAAPPAAAGFDWGKMLIRSFVGVAMLAFFALMMLSDHIYMAIVIVIGQVITWSEAVSVRRKPAKDSQLLAFNLLQWYWVFVSLYFFYAQRAFHLAKSFGYTHPLVDDLLKYHPVVVFGLYVVAFVSFVLTLSDIKLLRYQISRLSWTIVCIWLVIGQSHFVMDYFYQGSIWVVVPHGLIMVNDIMAYYCGIALGKKIIGRALTPFLSPNKTWEGFFGAMLFTMAFAFFLTPQLIENQWLICPSGAYDSQTNNCTQVHPIFTKSTFEVPAFATAYFNQSSYQLYPFQFHAVVFSLFASLIAPFGGFLASGIKRAFGVKDYASIFPGHGGFMDRVDCQFMMTTFVYVYVITFINPVTPYSSAISQADSLSFAEKQQLLQHLSQTLGQSANI